MVDRKPEIEGGADRGLMDFNKGLVALALHGLGLSGANLRGAATALEIHARL